MTYTFPIAPSFPASSMRRELDRLFEEAFTGRPSERGWQPGVSAREDAAGFTLDMDLPGVDPAGVEVLAEDGVLTIKGTRGLRETGADEKVLFAEQPYGAFTRRFRLPKWADLQAVQASYGLGVLTVRIGKVAPAQARRVPVTVVDQPAPRE
jgi:HSP20 family protein